MKTVVFEVGSIVAPAGIGEPWKQGEIVDIDEAFAVVRWAGEEKIETIPLRDLVSDEAF